MILRRPPGRHPPTNFGACINCWKGVEQHDKNTELCPEIPDLNDAYKPKATIAGWDLNKYHPFNVPGFSVAFHKHFKSAYICPNCNEPWEKHELAVVEKDYRPPSPFGDRWKKTTPGTAPLWTDKSKGKVLPVNMMTSGGKLVNNNWG